MHPLHKETLLETLQRMRANKHRKLKDAVKSGVKLGTQDQWWVDEYEKQQAKKKAGATVTDEDVRRAAEKAKSFQEELRKYRYRYGRTSNVKNTTS